jgi:histidinol dehydrogenase
MSTITIDEQKLEEVAEKVIDKKLSLTFQDMEEVRKSLAAATIRLEGKFEKIEEEIKTIKEDIKELKEDSKQFHTETKEDIKQLHSEVNQLRQETKEDIKQLRSEMATKELVEQRFRSIRTPIYWVAGIIITFLISITLKLFL